MTTVFILCAALITVVVSWGFSKCRKPLLTAVKSAVSGVSALLMVNIFSGYTGCYIAVNAATVFIATVLSLPGVFSLLVLKIIFNH